jgi:hypothetical protein
MPGLIPGVVDGFQPQLPSVGGQSPGKCAVIFQILQSDQTAAARFCTFELKAQVCAGRMVVLIDTDV